MSRTRFAAVLLVTAALLPAAATAAELSGRVILAKSAQGKPSPEVVAAQVYFTPETPVAVEMPDAVATPTPDAPIICGCGPRNLDLCVEKEVLADV